MSDGLTKVFMLSFFFHFIGGSCHISASILQCLGSISSRPQGLCQGAPYWDLAYPCPLLWTSSFPPWLHMPRPTWCTRWSMHHTLPYTWHTRVGLCWWVQLGKVALVVSLEMGACS